MKIKEQTPEWVKENLEEKSLKAKMETPKIMKCANKQNPTSTNRELYSSN